MARKKETTQEIFGRNLKTMREKKGITQTDLAEKIKVTPSYVSMLEAGERTPSLDLVESVCNVFDVAIGDMFDA